MDREQALAHLQDVSLGGYAALVNEAYDKLPAGIEIRQVYSKYAVLQIRFFPNDDAFSVIIDEIEERSQGLCEICGKAGDWVNVNDWEYVLCVEHAWQTLAERVAGPMQKVLIFGNSGSGKSRLAQQLAERDGLAHLDLDSLAWEPTTPPQRKALAVSEREIKKFTHAHDAWVIEGCYADLLQLLVSDATEMIFLNLSSDLCIANARQRPWEPHKYASKQAQDANLDMLIEWIKTYPEREDVCSHHAHDVLFETFDKNKIMLTTCVDLP